MSKLETLTEKEIRQIVPATNLHKAQSYLGRINNPVRIGHSLRAEVQDNAVYQVEIDFTETDILTSCTCSFNWGGVCPHVGAVLLKWLQLPNNFTVITRDSTQQASELETFTVQPPAAAAPKTRPDWLEIPFLARRAAEKKNLHAWFADRKVQELRDMARQRGWPISGTRKEEIIQQIVDRLLEPGGAPQSLIQLDAEHRQVYQAIGVLQFNIPYRIDHLTALTAVWGPLRKYKKIETYLSHLHDLGLTVSGQTTYSYPPHLDFIPVVLHSVLPPLLAGSISEATLPTHSASSIELANPRLFWQRLNQVFSFLEQSNSPLRAPMPRPRLEKFHDILKDWDYVPGEVLEAYQANSFKRADATLRLTAPPPQPALNDDSLMRLAPIAGDATQLNFMYHLLVAVGLLLPGSPIKGWRDVKEQFFRLSAGVQHAILARTYFSLLTWTELWLAVAERPSLQLKHGKNNYRAVIKPSRVYETLALYRHQVLQLLACLPDNRWFSLDDITPLLRPLWVRFDSQELSVYYYDVKAQPDWFLADNGRQLQTDTNQADWDMAQGAFVRHIIQGPLHWLGLADLALEQGQVVAFRLHGLGDLYFDRAEAVALDGKVEEKADTAVEPKRSPSAITIQDTKIIVQPTAVSAQGHNFLDSISILEETKPTRFVYQLHAAAVHQSFEGGQTLTQLFDNWQQWLGIAMPDTIRQQLTAWWNAYGQIRLYDNITIIEFADDYALTEMKAVTSLEKHLIAEISPRLVIISASAINTLVAELEKAHYTPKQTDKVS